MSVLRGGKQKEQPSGPKLRLGWRQRARIVAVPKKARALLVKLEARATEPEYMEHVTDIVRELEDDPAMVTFGLFHTPEYTLLGVVVVVGAVGLVLLDAKDGHPYAEFRWPTLCRFDVKHDRDYQIVGLAWHEGERAIAERLAEGTALRPSELWFAYLYMHADDELLAAIKEPFERAAIPEELHQMPPLLEEVKGVCWKYRPGK